MKFKWTYFVGILGLCLMGACTRDLGEQVIDNVAAEFIIDMVQKLDGDQDSLMLQITSVREFDNNNIAISTSQKTINDILKISIDSFIAPTNPSIGNAPASSNTVLGVFENGSHKIQINLQSAILNSGTLSVDNDTYYLGFTTLSGIEIGHIELHKIPKQTIWGYITYQSYNDAYLAQSFKTDLENLSDALALPNGYYGHFSISDESAISIAKLTAPFQQRFVRHYEGTTAALQNLLDSYRNNAPEGVEYKIYTSKGEIL